MSETTKVNDLSVSHKGSNGFVRNTVPDVCKTPSPAGPVPIPYPVIVSRSGDLANGTTTFKVDGGNMVSIKGSEYSRCTGDEPGTAGGVKSSTNMKEAKWILYSFDVKFDGSNVCRKTDKMTMNHENTVSLGGDFELPVAGAQDNAKDIRCAIHECDNKTYDVSSYPADERCKALGTKKHTCVANHKKIKNKEPQIYSETFVDMTPKPPAPPNVLISGGKGVHNFFQAANTIGSVSSYQPGSLRRPDLMYQDKNGQRVVADAKFPCPSDATMARKGNHKMTSPVSGASMLTGSQKADYKRIQGNGADPEEIQPSDCSADDCK